MRTTVAAASPRSRCSLRCPTDMEMLLRLWKNATGQPVALLGTCCHYKLIRSCGLPYWKSAVSLPNFSNTVRKTYAISMKLCSFLFVKIFMTRYCLVASKQMVGLFLMIWARKEMKNDIRNLKVSCVGRGLMGYLGNKGSISISMALHQTSFCFVCSHLTSGQKDGDEHRRNSDVLEILKKTRFPRVCGQYERSPETILEHDRIIWLGDLNYRIALSYRSVKALVEMRNWKALLEKDQLTREQRGGRVFPGWNEGRIYFPPTYKYSNNSDKYAGEDMNQKEKKRTPAWCDRILWYGRGLSQLSYVRGESRFSDHRPVYSMFIAEVESINHSQIQKMSSWSSQLDIEELLPYSYGYTEIDHYGYTDLNFY
ncbi:Type IV inositol polyphosphate 5-phosphatase 7 [Zea mays]|uniref:Type IV inositol polyphosphate 5-phosphatase 7 n=1 Tax=Zea mays TaxID=4577 RepID=A0A1D6KUZ9_MAIZE|nr:Type IV inositol polyphosphate 5-phosphatase 7 [Zea mays]